MISSKAISFYFKNELKEELVLAFKRIKSHTSKPINNDTRLFEDPSLES